MRTVTMRGFRDRISGFDEPVKVVRQTGTGEVETLGVWTPDGYRMPATGGKLSPDLPVKMPLIAALGGPEERDRVMARTAELLAGPEPPAVVPAAIRNFTPTAEERKVQDARLLRDEPVTAAPKVRKR